MPPEIEKQIDAIVSDQIEDWKASKDICDICEHPIHSLCNGGNCENEKVYNEDPDDDGDLRSVVR